MSWNFQNLPPFFFLFQFVYDTETHFTQTWSAMEALVHKGLVKAIGVSNFNQQQLQIIMNNSQVSSFKNLEACSFPKSHGKEQPLLY